MRKLKEQRYLLLLLAEAIVLLLLLPGCFQKKEKVACSLGEQLTLTPGVYEIWVQAQLLEESAQGQSLTVELQSENAYYRSLRTNAVTIHPKTSKPQTVVISAWVTDKITDASVQCDFTGDGVVLSGLELFRTARGNRTRWFTVCVGFLLLDGILFLRRRILDGKMTQKQQVVCWAIVAEVVLAYFPYLTDYFTLTDGTQFYLAKIVKLTEDFQGNLSNLPSLLFGNLFLAVPIGLKWLGFPIVTAYKLWVFLTVVATAVIAYHMFYQCVKEEYAALFGSMFYLLIPYRLFSMYRRGDVGEALLMAFLPLVVCGIYVLATERKQGAYKKMLLADTAEGGRVLQLGSGAILLLVGYLMRSIWNREKISFHCLFWLVCTVFSIGMALLHVPGRWLLAAVMSIAMFVCLFYHEMQGKQFAGWLFGMVAVLTICSAIYHGNRIAFTSEAVYLYELQNMENLYQEGALSEEGGAQ